MPRARAIIIRDRAVALIERRRAGQCYYVFPGGGVEAGETPHDAARREAREELGLLVEVGKPVAETRHQGDAHTFFLAEIVGGQFGAGDGDEVRGLKPPERGAYTPVWLPVEELTSRSVYPRAIARLVADAVTEGWPATPLIVDISVDEGDDLAQRV